MVLVSDGSLRLCRGGSFVDWERDCIHSQMIPQLHNPHRSTGNLNDREDEIKTLHDGSVDGPSRGVGPFLIATP